jgi:redox-sensitive bicupin YhaK (pirin superfamily)
LEVKVIEIRRHQERGRTNLPWLDSRHTFSFGGYHDPKHMGFGALRVINEDRVMPGAGFPTHGHRDMEIVTYVLEGELAHRDSTGTSAVIRAGEVQRMSAGTGISHSEFNNSTDAAVHFLQIWILPERPAITPAYEQRAFDAAGKAGQWQLIASADGEQGSLTIHQDVRIYLAHLGNGTALEFTAEPKRKLWMQVVHGAAKLSGQALSAGDGAAIFDEPKLLCESSDSSEVMLFDLA